jgi:hypothetical protein
MYMSAAQAVRMAEMTLTELRKDLFRAADRVLETGEPIRMRRKGRVLELRASSAVEPAPPKLSRAERLRRHFAQGPRQDAPDLTAEELDSGHWVWTEPEKFSDDKAA